MDTENKILLFGGTFNPIHNGHLIMAQEAVERLDFNEVIFIPSATPPHKEDAVGAYHRVKMTKLGIEDVDYFKISDVEEKREGPSYTYDTVQYFREKYPESLIYWMIGTDTIPELKTWYKIEDLVNECKFLIAERNPYKYYAGKNEKLFDFIEEHTKTFIKDGVTNHFVPLVNSILEISSTDIRKRVKNCEYQTIRFFIPDQVEQYIYDNNLYRLKS